MELDKDAIVHKLPIKQSSVESIVISGKMSANPKLKAGTAMIALKTLTAAVALIDSSGKDTLEGIEVTWAGGSEPEAVRQAREREQASTLSNGNGTTASKRSASNTPEPAQSTFKLPKLDENDVLSKMRARERERERLEEEIRRQDAEAEQQ